MTARLFRPGEIVPGTKYQIVRQLGAGGMGVVYQVVKPPQITGVLKLMAADLAVHDEFRTRFFDEVRVLAQLDHPNIVKVFDYDALEDGTPFYVMEMLHGRTVRDVLEAVGRVPPRVAFEITRQLLEALHCAHTNAIPVVHRDIKPENIFLHAPKHGDPQVKLIDFGVVAIADRQHDGTFVGTWKYAAPEQIRGEQATPATDLYAVGLVLYEMLGGSGPFDRYETGPAVATAHVREVPAPVSMLAPWVPASIVALVSSALAKDPRERPRDAYAFAERLFELEWATDGKDPRDATREGPLARDEARPAALARVLTDVGVPSGVDHRASDGKVAAPESARHRGSTLRGVGDGRTTSDPPPDEEDLLAGLAARDVAPSAPSSRRPRDEARSAAASAPARPSRPIHDAMTLEAPETTTPASADAGPSPARRARPDAFTRIVLPLLALVTTVTVVTAIVLVVRRRHALETSRPAEAEATSANVNTNANANATANVVAPANANANANASADATAHADAGAPTRARRTAPASKASATPPAAAPSADHGLLRSL